MATTLISLDTSTNCTGWAVYMNGELYKHGYIDVSKEEKENKFQVMAMSIYTILDENEPDIIVLETPVVNRNVAVQRKLSQMTGVIMGWCYQNSVEYEEMRPTEWRKGIIEQGKKKRDELKELSIKKVKELFDINVKKDDESDAILIGLAYIHLFDE